MAKKINVWPKRKFNVGLDMPDPFGSPYAPTKPKIIQGAPYAAAAAPMAMTANPMVERSAAEAKKIIDRYASVRKQKGEAAAMKDMAKYVSKKGSDRIKSLWNQASTMSEGTMESTVAQAGAAGGPGSVVTPRTSVGPSTVATVGENVKGTIGTVKGTIGTVKGTQMTAEAAAGAAKKPFSWGKAGLVTAGLFLELMFIEGIISDIMAQKNAPAIQELVGQLNLLSQGINPALKKEEMANNMLNQQKIQHLMSSLAGKETALQNLQSPGSVVPFSMSAPAVAQGEELISGNRGQEGSMDQQALMQMLQGAVGG
jgi:hypothetical protein